jgi:hypothetical protein
MNTLIHAAPALSLADLEAHDPQAPARDGGTERRFLCPICGPKYSRARHRCLNVNMESGAWNCKRCRTRGKLREWWTERPAQDSRTRARAALRRAFELPPVTPTQEPAPNSRQWREHLKELQPLQSTPGAEYLTRRGIVVELAHQAGARFSRDFYRRPAVMFPIRARNGQLMAVQGRYTDGHSAPKTRTVGDKRLGIFATPGAWDTPSLLIVEAPIDALSLAAAGFPSIALCGTSGPTWLRAACAFRRVLLAFDADEVGDEAADELGEVLMSYGARAERLRAEGAKDWNELLQCIGAGALADVLAVPVLMEDEQL